MKPQELNINLNASGDEAVLRIGEAPKIYDPIALALTGTINAPADFAENRKGEYLFSVAHAVFNKKDMSIVLTLNDGNKFADVIAGKMVMNEFLASLHINSQMPYTRQTLYDTFRHQRRFFYDKASHADLLLTLSNFDDKVYVESQGQKDLSKGQQSAAVQSKLTSNLEGKKIVLVLPLMEGGEKEAIELSIELSANNGQARFWLISDELPEMIDTCIETCFKEQKERLQALGIICIDSV